MEIKLESNGEIFYLNKFAKQANGSIFYKNGKTALLATVTTDESESIEGDFLPLTVQYIEKSYANGKFPGGYIKREGKPNEFEILTSRLIDRSIRPLFPKNYKYQVQVTIITLSIDTNSDIQVLALNAACIALLISNIPLVGAINALRIGKIDGELILNPSPKQLIQSSIDLFIAGEGNNILMIEFKSNVNELNEEEMIEALEIAQKHINSTSLRYMQLFAAHKKDSIKLKSCDDISYALNHINENYQYKIQDSLFNMAKSESPSIIKNLIKDISSSSGFDESDVRRAIGLIRREYIRNKILYSDERLDGRGLDSIREINIETNILPSAHGSALFTRGETQVLCVCTIGSENDMQLYDSLTSKIPLKEKFLFHYNFPSFSTGETYSIGLPTRRELGHGNLAKKALESSIKSENRAIRVVSEVLESNGSSSMASVCGGSLSLAAAGVHSSFLVAGVAMGLVKEKGVYKILTDITGLEDYDGDMDFKVAGNNKGITALQMDVKVNVDLGIIQEAIYKAKKARLHILHKMEIAKASIIPCENTPLVLSFDVPLNKISSIIGHGGKNIKEITSSFNVIIDINKNNGQISISSNNKNDITNAKDYILSSINVPIDSFNIGDRFKGKIKRIASFGIFVELRDGVDGLIHNTRLAKYNLKASSYKEDSLVDVEIIAINEGKVELSIVDNN